MSDALERNARVQARYDELAAIGRHGHYETMFQVVREEVELSRRALPAPSGEMREILARAMCEGESTQSGIEFPPWEKRRQDYWLRLADFAIAALRPSASPQGDESAMLEVLADEVAKTSKLEAEAIRENKFDYTPALWRWEAALKAMQRVSRIAAPERIKAQGGE